MRGLVAAPTTSYYRSLYSHFNRLFVLFIIATITCIQGILIYYRMPIVLYIFPFQTQ